jgi:Helix-turn-helix domain
LTIRRFSTPEDVARHLQITRRQVLQAARQNLLPAHPISFGGRRRIWRFKISEVDVAIAGRTAKSNGVPIADEGTMAGGSSRSRKEKSNG